MEEDILWLDVAVNDVLLVEKAETPYDLVGDEADKGRLNDGLSTSRPCS